MSYYPVHSAYVSVPNPYRCSTAHVVIAWILAVGTSFYLLPWAIAATRNRPNVASVALVNILLGWTLIGWVAALVMACGRNPEYQTVQINHFLSPPPVPLGYGPPSSKFSAPPPFSPPLQIEAQPYEPPARPVAATDWYGPEPVAYHQPRAEPAYPEPTLVDPLPFEPTQPLPAVPPGERWPPSGPQYR